MGAAIHFPASEYPRYDLKLSQRKRVTSLIQEQSFFISDRKHE
jgi:hypothetical protein